MKELTTTLRLLRSKNACRDRYDHLVKKIGDYGDDKPIPLWRILEVNGFSDAIWSLRAVGPGMDGDAGALVVASATACADQILFVFEKAMTEDFHIKEDTAWRRQAQRVLCDDTRNAWASWRDWAIKEDWAAWRALLWWTSGAGVDKASVKVDGAWEAWTEFANEHYLNYRPTTKSIEELLMRLLKQ